MVKLKDGFQGQRMIVLPPLVNKMQEADPLASSLYITDIGYFPQAENHFRDRPEGIEQNVLIYCVEGKGFYRLLGEEFSVQAGQFFVLPKGVPHAYGSSEANPWTIYWLHFCGTQASYYTEGVNLPQDVRPGLSSRISDRNAIFEEIFLTLENGYSLENLRYASSLLHYYLASMRFLQQYRKAQSHTADLAVTDVVKVAEHFMRENLERRLSMTEIAEYIGYTTPHFAEVFKAATGHTPLSYFNLLKVQAACRMLDETDMHINQICFKVGIDDCYYFSRLFSKTMGMSPRQYRSREK